jgi:tetratricopeptide (TPR) repeat protein
VAYFKLGHYADARHRLERAFALSPTTGTHADLGAYYARRGDTAKAMAELDQAIQLERDNAFAHCELGDLLLASGTDRLADAQAEFMQAKTPGPMFVFAAIGLSTCYLRQGRVGAAEKELRDAIKQAESADIWRLHVALAWLLISRGQDEQNARFFAEAHKAGREAIRLAADSAVAHYAAGSAALCYAAGQDSAPARNRWYRSARDHLRNCLDRDPDQHEAERMLADVGSALAAERRSVAKPRVQLSLAGVFLLLVLAAVTKIEPLPLTVVFALLAAFLVIYFGDRIGKVNISHVLAMEFNPGQQAAPVGPIGNFAVGIDRFDLPPRPLGQTPSRA